MKFVRLIIFVLLGPFFLFLSGCNNLSTTTGNGTTSTTTVSVPDAPEFVEMYLNEDSVVAPVSQAPSLQGGIIQLSEVTTIPDTSEQTTIVTTAEYGGSVYSESDFEVIVITSGENYDLLYSVELHDSLLGDCVYTDQSTLYRASSTIIVEGGAYRTQVVLTIPGSVDHTTYLSERTISLTKILFSRDTVSGTFPADIPDNTTTSLLFEVHAIRYFDADLGLPVTVNDGAVDIILNPESPTYAQAETAAISAISIPDTLNGYPIGAVVLESLDWVTSLEINGAKRDVMILGNYPLLTTLTLDGLEFIAVPALSTTKYLIINGQCPLLSDLTIRHTRGYDIYLSEVSYSQNEVYDDYLEALHSAPYGYPALEGITIDDCHANVLKIGADQHDVAFDGLAEFSLADSIIGTLTFGDEDNDFENIESVSLATSSISSASFSGTKPPEETAATFSADTVTIDWILSLSGSLFSTVSLTGSSMGEVSIRGGTVEPSRFSGISVVSTLFNRNSPRLNIFGSHPALTTLNISNASIPSLKIGDIESVFSHLTEISFSDFLGGNLVIGDRDCQFPLLEEIRFTHVDCGGYIRIGGENATYDVLDSLTFENVEARSVDIGYFIPVMNALSLILLKNVEVDETISTHSEFDSLDTIVIDSVSTNGLSINAYGALYEIYFNQLTTQSLYLLNTNCSKIYVTESPVTEWEYVDDTDLTGIPIETGTYIPE